MQKENLLGNVYGKLTVIAEAPRRNNRTYWLCRCECGTELEVLASNLKRGNTKTCGYCGNGGKKLDLTGKRFGSLVAIEESEHRSSRNEVYWKCLCDCGKETTVRIGHLTSGRIKSCGCGREGKPNEYEVIGDTVYVKLNDKNGSTDKIMICDLDDWERLKVYSWHDAHGYASTGCRAKDQKHNKFHRMVVDAPDGLVVDHINRNTYDNRKCNLRVVSVHANTLNRSMPCTNTTGHMGVVKRANGKWQSRICFNGQKICLVTFDNLEDAIKARKDAEEKYFKPLLEMKYGD